MTFVWDTSVMGHLHAQVKTTKKGGDTLPPLCSGVMWAPAGKPETMFAHMLGGRAASGPAF